MSEYFTPIAKGIQSVFEGMSISLASMFVRPVTVQYPEVDIRDDKKMREDGYKGPLRGLPDNYRGLLHVDLDLCACCHVCEKVCPIGCIVVDDVKADKTKITNLKGKEITKSKSAIQFDIDFSKCMFCGLCVEPCSTGAIYHTKEFVFNKSDRDDLIKRFVSPEERERLLKRAEEVAAEEAEAKETLARAKAAKAEASVEGSEQKDGLKAAKKQGEAESENHSPSNPKDSAE